MRTAAAAGARLRAAARYGLAASSFAIVRAQRSFLAAGLGLLRAPAASAFRACLLRLRLFRLRRFRLRPFWLRLCRTCFLRAGLGLAGAALGLRCSAFSDERLRFVSQIGEENL